MTESVKGLLEGNTITLEAQVPALDGKRVLVLLEAVDEHGVETLEAQRQRWQEWIARGPQGPIDDAPGEPDFPS